jgi:hypothetical protein
MQKAKRYFILAIILVIICLSGYLFLNLMDEFLDLVFVFKSDLDAKFLVFLIFSFLISIIGIVSVIFNWKYLKSSIPKNDSELLDEEESISKKNSGFLFTSYYIFGILIIAFGFFLGYLYIKEVFNRNELNIDGLFLTIILIILVFGIFLNRDARKL